MNEQYRHELGRRRAALLLSVAIPFACRTQKAPGGDGAPPTSPAESASAATSRVGARVRTADYEIRASSPEDCTKASRSAPAELTRRVGVEVSLVRLGAVQVPANPYYARLVDSAGNVYEATLGGCGAALAPTLPSRGQTAHGYVVFDVPHAAEGFTFAYAPELSGVEAEEITIPIGG
jgi:hypothetical protein